MKKNPPIDLGGRSFDYICDININKNGNALRKNSYVGQKAFTYDISTHDNDEFCRFMIPPLWEWSLQKLSGIYIICKTFTHFTLFYLGQTNNLPRRFMGKGGYAHISQFRKNPHAAQINKQIYAKIIAGNLLQIYFHSNVPDESKRKEIEADLIHKYNPNWNTQLRSD